MSSVSLGKLVYETTSNRRGHGHVIHFLTLYRMRSYRAAKKIFLLD